MLYRSISHLVHVSALLSLALAGCMQNAEMGGFSPLSDTDGADTLSGGTGGDDGGAEGTTAGGGSTAGDDGTSGTGASDSDGSGTTTGENAVCGNGIVEGDEACDDGNDVDGDGCEPDCTLPPGCGDGIWQAKEVCHAFDVAPDVGGSAAGVAIADLDADGDADLVASMPASGRILRTLFEGGAISDEAEFVTVPTPLRLIARDGDGDGDVDLLAEAQSGNYVDIAYLENNGAGSFTKGTDAIYGGNLAQAVGHFDEDDVLDAAVVVPSDNFPNVTYTYSNLPSGAVVDVLHVWVWQPTTPSAIDAADVDGDGRDDLIAVTLSPPGIELVHMDPGGVPGTSTTLSQIPISERFTVADVSGDGVPDVVSLFANEPKAMVLELAPDGSVGGVAYAETPDLLVDVSTGDVDGDGRLDLVAASNSQELLFLRNAGAATFEMVHSLVLGDIPSQIALGDLNGDGRDDVACALPNFGEIRVAMSAP
ncbi:MAG: VCBS repeat-containing protein [Deltaproteobacteria bacterium]|nr:MAG: VCBS repeat-containing protein [Deltaproteobacteria bacterium]